MKKTFSNSKIGLALGISLFLVSCGGQTTNEQQQTDENPSALSTVGGETKDHVNEILDEYYTLNAALVDTDAEKAQSAGQKLAGIFEEFDVNAVQEDLQAAYEEISGKIHQHAKEVAQAEDIEVQRERFVEITAGVYDMLKTFNANEHDVYYAYCPMAFDNTGAYWLSDKKEIRNPYFGSKMLKCGSVKETIAEN